ncbi:MAG: penicillin-binding protein 2 [Parasporobacterium sp.]|nr:penicillin-binding protein 2 [Parasporobacterium sp.]
MTYDTDKHVRKINRVRKKINKGRVVNREISRVFIFFSIVFAALGVYIVLFLAFDSSSVINNSYNRRTEALDKSVVRGSILASDGTALAYTSVDAEGREYRYYPYSNYFAHSVGFSSNGMLGIESSYNYYLLTSHASLWDKISNEFRGIKNPGDSVLTTLNTGLQIYISDLLGNNNAAVICMNPDTGEVYAMVSKPEFDPNVISEIWEYITSEEGAADGNGSILLNRTTQGLYTPGSTFKIFTLYEYYREHPEKISVYSYDCEGSVNVGDTSISCFSGAHGHEDLKAALANSCNCSFGTIGSTLDLAQFAAVNKKLLFDTTLPIDISSYSSVYSLKESDSDYDIMATAIGQGNTQVTPLHLAMVVSAIANDGVCMKPHLVKSIINPYGEVTKQFKNEIYTELFTPQDASFLKEYLRAVVTDGTASAVYPGNFVAYGKTGTAEKESDTIGDYDHSWFAGWAENNEQKLCVCVLIENMESSGLSAVYVSKLIFDYYFSYF